MARAMCCVPLNPLQDAALAENMAAGRSDGTP